jgi:murein L,D-transpeptidase YcbB/YkuD
MKIHRSQAGGLLALAGLCVILAGCRKDLTDGDVVAAIRQAVDSAPLSRPVGSSWPATQAFYRERAYQPIWAGLDGLTRRGHDFLTALCDAESQGLRAQDYDLPLLRDALARAYDRKLARDSIPRELSRLELRLTATFLRYGTHLFSGRLDPAAVDSGWFISERRTGADSVLRIALRASTFGEMIRPLVPVREEYGRLVRALGEYRSLAARGGWSDVPVPSRIRLKPHAVDSLIPHIRRRLLVTGELTDSTTPDPFHYDLALARAVAAFQDRHGLEVDSVIGRSTIEAMNVPVDMRIGQIELNMERYRWLPDNLGSRHILVNIPDYHLYAYDDGHEVFQMRVVVGKDFENPTPVFADSMSYIVFRPYWNVPPRIVKEEIIPAIRTDTAYLTQHNYEILQGREVVDPSTIDWPNVDTATFKFHVRQKPGPLNSLGLVKFMFPNQFDVYLHDTPTRSLFQRAGRAASHGCIRVERPEQLAQFALSRNPDWDLRKIRDAMQQEEPQQVGLRQKVPVYIVYFTSFVHDGVVGFRSDLYGTDQRAIARMREGSNETTSRALCRELRQLAEASHEKR